LAGLSRAAQRPAAATETLTPQERRLLQYLADGLTNKQIAVEMNVSENTVKYHLKNILQKLGAQNRTEAAAYAVHSGLSRPGNLI
jgi:DNA-binding NarL/FixJ family response regulator